MKEWPSPKTVCQPEFTQDLNAVKDFLYQYRGNKRPLMSTEEMERILQWCWNSVDSLLALKRADIEHYISILSKPPPVVDWHKT